MPRPSGSKMASFGSFISTKYFESGNSNSKCHSIIYPKRLVLCSNIISDGRNIVPCRKRIILQYGDNIQKIFISLYKVYYACALNKKFHDSYKIKDEDGHEVSINTNSTNEPYFSVCVVISNATLIILQCFDQIDILTFGRDLSEIFLNGLGLPSILMRTGIQDFLKYLLAKSISHQGWIDTIKNFKSWDSKKISSFLNESTTNRTEHTENTMYSLQIFIEDNWDNFVMFSYLLCISDPWNFGIDEKIDFDIIRKDIDDTTNSENALDKM